MLTKLKSRVNDNSALTRRGKWVNLSFILGIGKEDYLIDIEKGHITQVRKRKLETESGAFSIRAKETAWQEHWKQTPKRDYHDIWSMLSKKLISLDGDLTPLIQNLQFFKELIASLREERV
jgi:hypothetical protein